eukprot:9930729-Lingulodinium_polyedra.AAC.1
MAMAEGAPLGRPTAGSSAGRPPGGNGLGAALRGLHAAPARWACHGIRRLGGRGGRVLQPGPHRPGEAGGAYQLLSGLQRVPGGGRCHQRL